MTSLYKTVLRPLLFLLPAEKAHVFTTGFLRFLLLLPGMSLLFNRLYGLKSPMLQRNLLGLQFSNPIGLAAGFDKDARCFREMGALGFGFVEIGTVTPLAQSGNPKPRLFRFSKQSALINRMGFNNNGVEQAAKRLKKRKPGLVIGGNIGKNKNTSNELALSDYEKCFLKLAPHVDYIALNISSPNTPGLRELQNQEFVQKTLVRLQALNKEKKFHRPILVKIAPDLEHKELDQLLDALLSAKVDGIIATNTTIDHSAVRDLGQKADFSGGLSGAPLREKSTATISYIAKKIQKKALLIGVGGIDSPEAALEKLDAGADLIQLYTGFVYEGPALIKRINRALVKRHSGKKPTK